MITKRRVQASKLRRKRQKKDKSALIPSLHRVSDKIEECRVAGEHFPNPKSTSPTPPIPKENPD